MVSKAVVILLFGATISTAQFIPNMAFMPNFHLGSITLPNFPVPLMQKPISAPIIDPCEPALIPEIPIMKPTLIPQQPALSAFVMPELPIRLPEEPVAIEPCPDDLPMKVVTVPEFIKPLKPIPPAPVLAPASLPELPVRVEMPKPVLTPLVVERPIEDPCITEVVVPHAEPFIIPQPPKPQIVMHEPVKVEVMKPMPMPFLPEHAEVEIMADPCEPSAQPIMPLADYPFFAKNLPAEVAIRNEKFKEYLVPNMVFNRFRSMPYIRRVM